MPEIKLNQPLLDYKGKPLLSVREYMADALNGLQQNEQPTAEQKAAVYQLTTKLYKSNKIKLTVDEAKLVKDQVGKFYGALVYGRICDLLEGNKPEPILPEEDLAATDTPNDDDQAATA